MHGDFWDEVGEFTEEQVDMVIEKAEEDERLTLENGQEMRVVCVLGGEAKENRPQVVLRPE